MTLVSARKDFYMTTPESHVRLAITNSHGIARGLPDPRDQPDPRDRQALQGFKDHKALRVLRDRKGQLGRRDRRDRRGQPERQVRDHQGWTLLRSRLNHRLGASRRPYARSAIRMWSEEAEARHRE